MEAGWDRTAPVAAAVNRLRIRDVPLISCAADVAASVHVRTGTGVADAHIGATVQDLPTGADVVVLSSDPDDMLLVSAPRRITAVAI